MLFAYPVEDSDSDKRLVMATACLEPMLGDTVIAFAWQICHSFILGKTHSIICNATLVNIAFGTGAIKITPTNDPND
jgi:valyl-tRNA synthetase